jgi:hypothetical protein
MLRILKIVLPQLSTSTKWAVFQESKNSEEFWAALSVIAFNGLLHLMVSWLAIG